MKPIRAALFASCSLWLACSAGTDHTGNASVLTDPTASASGIVVNSGASATALATNASANASSGARAPSSAPTGSAVVAPLGPEPAARGVVPTSQVPRISLAQYDAALRDLLGVTTLDGQTPRELLGLGDNFGPITGTEWTQFQLVAAQIAKFVINGPSKARFIDCDATQPACLEATVKTFGRKVFRRPLTEQEVNSLVAFGDVTPKGTSDQIASAVLNAFLIAPSFLTMPELSTEKGIDGNYKLSGYELAARLAALVWNGIPDDELLDAAEQGQLLTRDKVTAQAQRMLAVTDKVAPMMRDFHRYYLRSEDWAYADHDPKLYPAWTSMERMRPIAMAEQDAFFSDVAVNGSFADLFLSPLAFVNQDTAPIYGLDPAMFGPTLTRVMLDPSVRPGFLTRAAFLSTHSRYDSTSPIRRGALIAMRMLGASPAPPKPGVPTEPPAGNYKTMREKIDLLTSADECAACHHTYLNPPGFVLEGFDAIGAQQTIDPLGGAIDTRVTLISDGRPVDVSAPLDLMKLIANGIASKVFYAERWVEFTRRREMAGDDPRDADNIAGRMQNSGYKISDVLIDLARTDTFNSRAPLE